MQSPIAASPLESFLERPDIEGSPAWEFIDGRSHQKPMPTLFHSQLQRNLELQKKILHLMSSGTKLAWLIDIQKQQVWVWQEQDLPLIYAEDKYLPVLDGLFPLTVKTVITMTQQK